MEGDNKDNKKGKKHWYTRWWGILIIILLALIIIFITITVLYTIDIIIENKSEEWGKSASSKTYDATVVYGNNSYWLGTDNPEITIVEFGDYACPYCKQSFSTIRELSHKYKDQIKIIYRDFPVVTNYSTDLAMAARCSGEQGLFWPMHDKLFINQGKVSGKTEILNLANQLSLDMSKFTKCLESKKYLKDIQKDYTDGQTMSITGTPTWIIDGTKISGDIPYDMFVSFIENLLSEKGNLEN